MNNSKEILKNVKNCLLLYIIPYLMGVYVGYYQGVDLGLTVQLGCSVMLFIIILTMVSLVKKEYYACKFRGYIMLFISIALLLQVILQGNILGYKRVLFCVISYILFFFLGMFIVLFTNRKIFTKGNIFRKIISLLGKLCVFISIILIVVGKTFSGRRSVILFDALGIDNTSTKPIWVVIWFLACMYGLICSGNLTYHIVKE